MMKALLSIRNKHVLVLLSLFFLGHTSISSASDEKNTSHPFPDDGYKWPSIYEEVDNMLDVSLLMYSFAQLREIARKRPEKLMDEEVLLNPPLTASQVNEVLEKNFKSLVKDIKEGDETFSMLDDAIDAIISRQLRTEKVEGRERLEATLEYFGDMNSQNQLVYGIGVSHKWQRITVAFRGSTTKQDWVQDLQAWLEYAPNPLASLNKKQPKKLGIHNGFYEYLFYETTSGTKNEFGNVQTKYEKITGQLVELSKRYPAYKIYVTGHSLGAALSSLFAFQLAASNADLPMPISCVSIASPYVGNKSFRKAFQLLEKLGKLRYLRVSNFQDLVSVAPPASFSFKLFKHVGVNLKLFPLQGNATKYFQMNYPKRKGEWKRAFDNMITKYFVSPPLLLRNHGISEYDARLEAHQTELRSMYLNDFYGELAVAGDGFIVD